MRRQEFSHDISACCCDISEDFSACARFFEIPEHARFWAKGRARLCGRRVQRVPENGVFPHGGPACAGKGSRAPVWTRSRCALRAGFPLCRAQVPRQGCFSPKRGFFCAGGAVAPAFMTGKRGIFLRGCTLKAQNRHGAPLCAEKGFTGRRCSRGTGSFFRAGRGHPTP